MDSRVFTLHNFLHAGDSAWVLPLAAGMALVLLLQRQWRAALIWCLALAGATITIVAGKLAFDLFGWSIPDWKLYNVSGHAMFAAALYPTLGGLLMAGTSPLARRVGVAGGVLVALAVACALVWRLDHTLAETLFGATVGFMAAALALAQRPSLQAPWRMLLVVLPLVGFLSWQQVYHPVHQMRYGVWYQVASWFDIEQRYTRRISRDPHTGEVEVQVRRARLRWS
ncbi:MAG: hypothetical protein M0R28_18365 [Pigmentiphaga sp.]|nr:hypothetical protein [Pigmentiphaga sp.]